MNVWLQVIPEDIWWRRAKKFTCARLSALIDRISGKSASIFSLSLSSVSDSTGGREESDFWIGGNESTSLTDEIWSKESENWYKSFLLQNTCSFVMCWNSPRLSIFWPTAVASDALHPSYFIIHFIARRPTKHRGISLKRWKWILASTLFLIFRARSFKRTISSFLGQFPAKSHAYFREISHFCCISSDGNDICHFTSWLPKTVRILQSSVPLMWISNFEMSLPSVVVVIAVTALPECNRMLWRRPLSVPFMHERCCSEIAWIMK